MNFLEKLVDLGYKVWNENGNIHYESTSKNNVNENILKPLIEKIKLNKDGVVKFLRCVDKFQYSQATQAVWYEHKALNENRVKGGWMVSEIIKSLHSGENIYELFLKAVECIGKLLGDEITPEVIKKDLIAIYGYGFKEKTPLEMELRSVEERLANLKNALEIEEDENVKSRIKTAIKAHENQISKIKEVSQNG